MKSTNNIQILRKTKFIILFDGLCSFCDSSVPFVIRRDLKNRFLFASLQSISGSEFMKTQPKFIQQIDSLILATDSKVYYKSTAAIKIAIQLKGFWFLVGIFYIIPTFLRDKVYDFIAKRRNLWFEKHDTCKIPTAKEKNKFLF